MTRYPLRFVVPIFGLGLGLVAAACPSGGGDDTCDPLVETCAVPTDAGGSDGGSTTGVDAALPTDARSLEIDPPMVTVTIAAGEMRVLPFQARLVRADGTRLDTNAAWTASGVVLGDVDAATGALTLDGMHTGTMNVVATVALPSGAMLSASAPVTVDIATVVAGDGIDDALVSTIEAAGTDTSSAGPSILYPLEGTILPQNVYAPDVQWTPQGAAGDVFRLHVSGGDVDAVAYVRHVGGAFTHDFQVPDAVWRAFATNVVETPIAIELARYSPTDGLLHPAPSSVAFRFANAVIPGSVYYWSVDDERVFRIDDGTADRVDIVPNPPQGAHADRANCIGCHEVSRSGRYMAGRLGGFYNSGAVFDLTDPLLETASPAPTTFPITTSSPQWWYASWNQDDSLMVVDLSGMAMTFMEPFTGTPLAPTSGAFPSRSGQPRWSPDGTQIAYVGEASGTYGNPFVITDGDLYVMNVTGRDLEAPGTKLVDGSALASRPEGGTAIGRPSWSPDGEVLAFFHATYTSSNDCGDGSCGVYTTSNSALYAIPKSGGTPARLDRAMGPTDHAYWPNFAPFYSGGYYWLSFMSRRDYGNDLAGTRGDDRQQIWVAAIDPVDGTGVDPSHPPYWLPGQRVSTHSVTAAWSPRPCRADGDSCELSGQCCSGSCTGGMCLPPETCHGRGEACGGAGCCEGLVCLSNACVEPPI